MMPDYLLSILEAKAIDGVIFCLRAGNGAGKEKGTCGVYSVSP